ncbi:hypothetical protein MMC28_000926 [Mycoblastus sanguinarius]|nr:hypothetical protein [Mycoblastus sanguinarius]
MATSGIFELLQAKIEGESLVREELKDIVQSLERQNRSTLSILSRAHSIPQKDLSPTLSEALDAMGQQRDIIKRLNHAASKHPYYKYNSIWSREMQNSCFAVVLWKWLNDFLKDPKSSTGSLLTIEDVGMFLEIPVAIKNHDTFHLTIEEYLHALISLIEELARLAVNSVTLGDNERSLVISRFVKDIHQGFQILNLKNDSLRKRSDSIKYSIKRIEEVVYDLKLRNLLPREDNTA